MAEGEMVEPLNTLFHNAEHLIAFFSVNNGDSFTFKQFLHHVTQRHQNAYIDLLIAARKSHEKPFGFAHQMIGARLAQLARKLGYERIEDGYTEDIFGNPAVNVVYRKIKG